MPRRIVFIKSIKEFECVGSAHSWFAIIPAKAGICRGRTRDPRLRGDDRD